MSITLCAASLSYGCLEGMIKNVVNCFFVPHQEKKNPNIINTNCFQTCFELNNAAGKLDKSATVRGKKLPSSNEITNWKC